MSPWVQLAGLAIAGCVVIILSRRELSRLPYGMAAWGVLIVFVVGSIVYVGSELWREEHAPAPTVIIPSEGAIAT